MNTRRYVFQSLWHYRYAYLGVFLGAVLGAMVLLGALFAGSSVDESLKQIGENRIGKTTHLVTGGDRFFREALAGDLGKKAGVEVAPVLFAKGVASVRQTTVNQVQLVGVTEAFWNFAPEPPAISLSSEDKEVAINSLLADRLSLTVGDTVIVRFQKPGVVAGNAPVAGGGNSLESLRATVATVVDDASFGRFGLETTQVPQASIFLPISILQEAFEFPGRANLLLINGSAAGSEIEAALNNVAQLADYQLSLEWLELAEEWEVKSDRVFIDADIGAALLHNFASARPVTSYLVNDIQLGESATPYSIGTALDPTSVSFLPDDLAENEVVLNDWTAEDLSASAGDAVSLTYFQTAESGVLVEKSAAFVIRSIIPLEGLAGDRAWMPNFPGISEAEVPSDWDAGLPLDLERVRDKDDEYWETHRGTPKVYLSIEAGKRIWATQWGNYTALRLPLLKIDESVIVEKMLSVLSPDMNQLLVQDFAEQAKTAASAAVDFGGLFVGMSFFLILAALGLVAMLFQFCLLQRNRETALLSSLGVRGKQLMRWRLGEAFVILFVGSLVGLPLAVLYTEQILRFLEGIWAGQTSASTFVFHADSTTVVTGISVFLILSMFSLWFSIRKQAKRSLSIRLMSNSEESGGSNGGSKKTALTAIIAAIVGIAAVLASGKVMPAQGGFYLAGFALLIAGLAICRIWLQRVSALSRSREIDSAYLAKLNISSRISRSLTVVGLIASAVFMVLSVASFRKQVGNDWVERSSGTGGFALLAETTSPQNFPRDGASNGFEIFENTADQITAVVPLRKGTGDNVNCFNLNTTSQPQLVGTHVALLNTMKAFSPSKMDELVSGEGWMKLSAKTSEGAIPALVDETTMMWALKKKVGAVFAYENEKGEAFTVKIVGTLKDSIFQGYLIVDESLLLSEFPSHDGYSLFLLDVAAGSDLEKLRNQIETSATDFGGTVELTRDILASFHEIENTYIAIFNVLGSLGVVLGSLGLTIVVARSIQERLGEFSVMTAIGISRKQLGAMVFSEYSRLIGWGLGVGLVASVISIWPNLQALPAGPTIMLVGGLLVGIVVLNLVCGILSFKASFPQDKVSIKQIER